MVAAQSFGEGQVKLSVRRPRSGQGRGAIRRVETVRVGFSIPNRTPVVPPEQCSDAAPQMEEPLDHRGRRRASRDHHGPQVLDRAASPATREPDRPHVLQRDVMEQCVHPKGARAEFTRVDTHIASCCSLAGRGW